MNLLQQFCESNRTHHLFTPKDKLLLAVSGGVDSVVLCELCKQAGYDFIIAHCNFKLRGAESERDEQFVRELGKKYGVETFVQTFDTEQYASEHKLSTQEAARELRYNWFKELVNSQLSMVNDQKTESSIHHSPFTVHLLTAHHADDNNETLLMNFFRGTGLHGLTGIPASAGYIRRPLLHFTKEQLMEFASAAGLGYVEDSSNESSKYTRNFFRNELIPAISKVFPQVKDNLQDNIRRFTETENLYRLMTDTLIKKLSKVKGTEVHFPVKQLMKYNNRALIYAVISPYGFLEGQVEEVIKLADSESGKYILSPSGEYRIIRHRHWFIISPVHASGAENIIIEKGDKEVLFSLGKLEVEITASLKPSTLSSQASLDSKHVRFPLLLRKWKTGDYFYPLGMKKKKKVSRFLIDKKLSLTEKENTWVVESAGRIIWVVGHRIDERFKVTDRTKQVLHLTMQNL